MDRYDGFETWAEVAADLGLTDEALSALLFPVCPRKGVRRIDEQGKVIPCNVCGLCDGELPF